jgi:tetratricopeptide (TPR) repeat protein
LPTEKRKDELPEQKLFELYQEALSQLHQKNYAEARSMLTRIREEHSEDQEFLARVDTYLKICESNLNREALASPGTAEEFFDLGVIHHNSGDHKKAVDCFEKALAASEKEADYIYYALAASQLPLGNTESALLHLKRAIEIRPENRYIARNDPDFELLTDNRQFLEMVKPQRSNN